MKTKNDLFEMQKLLINNLKEIIKLKNSVKNCKEENTDQFMDFILGIIEVIDTYEKAIELIVERELNKDENSKFIINRFNSVNKTLLKLLKKNGVTRLEFPENRLLIDFCKVINKEPDSNLPNDTKIEIVRNGYIHGKKIIRKAEVIIVKN